MIRHLPSTRVVIVIAAAVVAAVAITAVVAGTRAGTPEHSPAAVSASAADAACPAEPGCTGRPECAPSKTSNADACCPAPEGSSGDAARAPVKQAGPGVIASNASGAPAAAGMIVGVNPETGKLGMPTPEQLAELAATEKEASSHSGEGLVEVRHPDGSVSIDLQDRFQEYTVARIAADGKPLLQCGDDPASVMRLLDAPAASSASTSKPAPAAYEER